MSVDLRYVGPFDEVRVPLATGGEINVVHGDVATFPDDLAASLLDQPSNWSSIVEPSDATVPELQAELERRGIAYSPKAKKDELLAAVAKADDPPAPPSDSGDTPPDPADLGDAN